MELEDMEEPADDVENDGGEVWSVHYFQYLLHSLFLLSYGILFCFLLFL